MLGYIRTVVASRLRELLSLLLGLWFKVDFNETGGGERSTKIRRQSTSPRSRNRESWGSLVW